MDLVKNADLAYWLGALHSDGKRTSYISKKNGNDFRVFEISLAVGEKSLPMLERFAENFDSSLGRKLKIHRFSDGRYKVGTSVKCLLEPLENLEIRFRDMTIPLWISQNPFLFGTYLAGVIDGDGDIRSRGYSRKTPQCCIRISNGKPNYALRNAIQMNMNCKVSMYWQSKSHVYYGRIIRGSWWTIEFVVSKKNVDWLKNYLLPRIAIPHKRLKLEKYLEKWCPGGVARSNIKPCRGFRR